MSGGEDIKVVVTDMVHNANNSNNGNNGNNGKDVVDANPSPEAKKQTEEEDATDAWGFGRSRSFGSGTVADMPVEREAETYNMNHRRRGTALIFNHMHFDSRLQLKQRNGTHADR